jgi:hypothetical protein
MRCLRSGNTRAAMNNFWGIYSDKQELRTWGKGQGQQFQILLNSSVRDRSKNGGLRIDTK